MIAGKWKGANEAGRDDCELCGETRNLRTIHFIGNKKVLSVVKDHLDICAQCFHLSNMPNWHVCDCGS